MRRSWRTFAIAITATVLAACGSGASSNSAKDSADLVSVTVPTSTTTGLLPTAVAEQQGYFKSHGLSTHNSLITQGGAEIPLLLNGQLTVGEFSIVNFLDSLSEGLPLQLLPLGVTEPTSASRDDQALVVSPSSGITNVSQLANKTIAIGSIGSVEELELNLYLAQHGVPVSRQKYTGIPEGASLYPAVQSGKVAAALILDPYRSAAVAAGARVLGYPNQALPSGPDVLMAVNKNYASSHPAVIRDLIAAYTVAADYANTHPAAARRLLAVESGQSVSSSLHLPIYSTSLTTQEVLAYASLLKQYGYIHTIPRLQGVLIRP